MVIPPSLRNLITASLILFSIETVISYAISYQRSIGTFDSFYEMGFPLRFYITGGFFNIHQFLPIPFLFDLVSVFIVVAILSKFLARRW